MIDKPYSSTHSLNDSTLAEIFPDFELPLLKAIEEKTTTRKLAKGELLLKTNQPLRNTYIIRRGLVKIFREDNEGGQFIITYLKPGQSFGVSISDDTPEVNKRSLMSCEAVEATDILCISFFEKDQLAKQYHRWYRYILQTAVMYHSFYLELIDSIVFQKMDHRIEQFLVRLSKVRQTSTLSISHQEIAIGLNSSREVVSRLLKKMEEVGRITMGHNMITLVDRE